MVIVLDAGPLGLVTNPRQSPAGLACNKWLQAAIAAGTRVIVPEIADYEVRRELLRAEKAEGLARLDALEGLLEYLPLSTIAMRQAAELWATARQKGQPTADDRSIDADVILAARALMVGAQDVIIATTNVGHLARFTSAALWTEL